MEARYQKYLKVKEEVLKVATKEEVVNHYEKRANHYDDDMVLINSQLHHEMAKTAKEYCPGTLEAVKVLDVGSGTGLVGLKLASMGFRHIDGVDISPASLEVAQSRNVYNTLICCYFDSKPLDIVDGHYDMVVTSGTLLQNHLPWDSLKEMVRLTRQGGIICIIARASSFDGVTVPEYRNMLPLIKELETTGRLRTLKWETPVPYIRGVDGIAIVFEVL